MSRSTERAPLVSPPQHAQHRQYQPLMGSYVTALALAILSFVHPAHHRLSVSYSPRARRRCSQFHGHEGLREEARTRGKAREVSLEPVVHRPRACVTDRLIHGNVAQLGDC